MGELWDLVACIEEKLGGQPVGRPRQIEVVWIVVLLVLARERRSVRAAARSCEIPHPPSSRSLLPQALADHPERRLGHRPPSRDAFIHFRRNHIRNAPDFMDRLMHIHETRAREQALAMGLFAEESGSWTHPASTQAIKGDGTWIRSPVNRQYRERPDPVTGELVQVPTDPGSQPLPGGDGDGQYWVLGTARCDEPNERCPVVR